MTFQGDTHRKESVPELVSRCSPYYTLVHGRGPIIIAGGTNELYTYLTLAVDR